MIALIGDREDCCRYLSSPELYQPIVIGNTLYFEIYRNGFMHPIYTDSEYKLHREDGPAFVNRAAAIYYRHGRLHRADGPAIAFHTDTSKELNRFYLEGLQYTPADFFERLTLEQKKKVIFNLDEWK